MIFTAVPVLELFPEIVDDIASGKLPPVKLEGDPAHPKTNNNVNGNGALVNHATGTSYSLQQLTERNQYIYQDDQAA